VTTFARIAIHPGEFLREELDARSIDATLFQKLVGTGPPFIEDILAGRAGITVSVAERIGAILGTSAEIWLNLQMQYKRNKCRDRDAPAVKP